jgi:hypothetical protein
VGAFRKTVAVWCFGVAAQLYVVRRLVRQWKLYEWRNQRCNSFGEEKRKRRETTCGN